MRFFLPFLFFSFSFLFGHDLVELKRCIPSIKIDLRYSTPNNFLGNPLYEQERIFVHHNVATRLKRVQEDLGTLGMGLIIYEGYRPPSVQHIMDNFFWQTDQAHRCKEARHYRKGLGVDVAIYRLGGIPLALPSEYDDESPTASRNCMDLPAHVYHNSALLAKYMALHGFEPHMDKWWHFDLRGWDDCAELELEYKDL